MTRHAKAERPTRLRDLIGSIVQRVNLPVWAEFLGISVAAGVSGFISLAGLLFVVQSLTDTW